MKPFKNGVILGRFQHIHVGHEKLINIGLKTCDRLLILVGSSDQFNTKRNPFSSDLRISLIEKIYKNEIKTGKILVGKINDLSNENDLTPEWGRYVIKTAEDYLGEKLECIIYGKDKNIFKCFDKEDVKNISEILVDRKSLNISATDMRNYILKDDYENWKKYTNSSIYERYNDLRNILINIKNN